MFVSVANTVIDAHKNNRIVTVRTNTIVVLRLHEKLNPGFYWLLDIDGSPLLRLLDSFPFQAPNGVVTYQWRFFAAAQGSAVIRLGYRQDWSDKPQKKFTTTIKIRDGAKLLPQSTYDIGPH